MAQPAVSLCHAHRRSPMQAARLYPTTQRASSAAPLFRRSRFRLRPCAADRSDHAPPEQNRNLDAQPLKAFPFIRHEDPRKLEGAHKPAFLVASSAWVLAIAVQTSGLPISGPSWLPIFAGGALGSLYVALNCASVRSTWRSPSEPLNVVVVGGSKGVGAALARDFLRAGDNVIVTSRSASVAATAAARLAREAGVPEERALSLDCDVADAESVENLVSRAAAALGGDIDVWVNNAGYSGSFQAFRNQDTTTLSRIVSTNLLGTMLCTRAAIAHMTTQQRPGHVFNTEGAGSDGFASPNYAAYGATKAGIAQFARTLQREAADAPGTPVGVHNVSPGMVLTELLLDGATVGNKQAFNILAEQPETVAAFLVPRMRRVAARGKLQGQFIRYLTPRRIVTKLLTAPMRRGRFFDSHGRPVYPSEEERLAGQHAKRKQRLGGLAVRRPAPLGVTYAASIAVAYLIMAAEAVAKAHGG